MELNKYIDHTNLLTTANLKDIEKLCDEALKYRFASVCVYPYYVKLASSLLKNTSINICTVIGFPSGMQTTEVKEFEAINAVFNGADEIDMVINMGAVKNKDFQYIKEEICTIRDAIDGKVLKVIIETCYLDREEIIKLTEICNETYVNFIKTSTGFGSGGAKITDVKIIMENANELLEVKASGGIKTEMQINEFIELGVTRIGTSNALSIMQQGGIEK